MPSSLTRRTVLGLLGNGFALATTGCLGDSPTGSTVAGPDGTDRTNSTADATVTSTDSSTRSTTPDRTSIPASAVSDTDAKERALAAEEAHLADRLGSASCLSNWGTEPTTASKRATVTDRTADGVRVELVHPYSYSTDRTEADGASNAVYVVTADDARRVSGDTVSPC